MPFHEVTITRCCLPRLSLYNGSIQCSF